MSEVKVDIIGLTASIIVWLGKQIKGTSGIKEVIEATHLQNKEGLRPILIKEHKTDTGIDYVFALPPGIIKDDFIKLRKHFETYLNATCEIESKGRKLILKTHKTEFEREIAFKFDPTLYADMIAPFPVGQTPDGKLIVEDLHKLPHMMCAGVTGFGKTSFVLGIAVASRLKGNHVSIIDRKGVDFNLISPWCNIALTEDETEELLIKHIAEMHRRLSILRESNCQNFKKYCEKHNDLPYLVLIIDELTQIENKKCFEAIGDIAVLSRVTGISMILATQRPDAKLWDGFTGVRSQCAGAMCFRVRDGTDSQIALGSGNTRGADLPKIPGRAIWNNDSDTMVQSMYLDADTACSILSEKVPKGVYKFEPTKLCSEGVAT